MENNRNIEQLFKNSFDDFEAEVHPDAWMNIQTGLNIQPLTHAASSSNGASAVTKVAAVSSKFGVTAIVGSAIAVISITAGIIYFSSENKKPVETGLTEIVASDESKTISTVNELQAPVNKNSEQKSYSSLKYSKTEKSAVSANNKISEKKNQAAVYLSSTDNSIITAPPVSNVTADEQNKQETKESPEIKQQVQSPKTIIPGQESKEAEQNNDESLNENNDLKTADAKQELAKTEEYVLGQIPDVITPNQDGKNDVFIINGNDLQSLKVSIFDRSGKLIHQWNNLHGFWDGKLNNGQAAVAGIYFYDIFAQPFDGKAFTKKGTIHLLKQ